ncbi:hypothetical protein C1924_10525 [Stenotrophomonas sp. ESTM1D_MKCIP4_1]|uniref:hypothetical protein n=1 Tax=Stenotrophomonas sp. ESTM1D_MKCIP4_1 TaxID=2072414 RepID=UPI000D53EF40|nr:hypothetical protein [Stenotrophomonas sp. ESTM1D_MKCIP4_1]AWH53584.1 hypothetical protein C1924_10525 [Stenotrophomonas sp. ESTM1D_MKCIP4_1]
MHTAALLLSLSTVASTTPLLRSEGVASLADGSPAYREVHWRRGAPEGAQHWVQYLCPDGRPFARKTLPATGQPLARGYQLQDARSGQTVHVAVAAGQVSIDWKEAAADAARRTRLPLPADAVIDTGFDAAVRAHWPALMQGSEVRLPFLVPGRQRFYPVTVRRTAARDWRGIPAQVIEVRLATWYGAVAPRLSLVYADDDRRLLEFRGTSNLRDARGAYPVVVVRFAAPATAQPMAKWQQAWAQPLVPQCSVSGG